MLLFVYYYPPPALRMSDQLSTQFVGKLLAKPFRAIQKKSSLSCEYKPHYLQGGRFGEASSSAILLDSDKPLHIMQSLRKMLNILFSILDNTATNTINKTPLLDENDKFAKYLGKSMKNSPPISSVEDFSSTSDASQNTKGPPVNGMKFRSFGLNLSNLLQEESVPSSNEPESILEDTYQQLVEVLLESAPLTKDVVEVINPPPIHSLGFVDMDNPQHVEELFDLRNDGTILLGLDVALTALIEMGIVADDSSRYGGRNNIYTYGGLQSLKISKKDLHTVVKDEEIPIVLSETGTICGAYIYGTKLSPNLQDSTPTPQERLLVGDSCSNLLQNRLHCSSELHESARDKALSALEESKLVYFSNLLSDRLSRRKYVATIEKLLAYLTCLKKGKEFGIFRIFELIGLFQADNIKYGSEYDLSDEGSVIHRFDPSIKNKGSFAVNKGKGVVPMGFVKHLGGISEMADLSTSQRVTIRSVYKLLRNVPEDKRKLHNLPKPEDCFKLAVGMNNHVFLVNLKEEIKRLYKLIGSKKINGKPLNQVYDLSLLDSFQDELESLNLR